MDNLVIYADTSASRETAVTEEAGAGTAFFNVCSDHLIDVVGTHTLTDDLACLIHRFVSDPSRFSHNGYLLGIFDRYHYLPPTLASASRTSLVVSSTSS